MFEIFYWILTSINYLVLQNFFLFQTFEWQAMLYLIETQKNRDIGQILFDYNNENITDKKQKDDPRTYRRDELNLKRVMKFNFFFGNFMFVVYCFLAVK